jgi:phage baseplate assembly protein W
MGGDLVTIFQPVYVPHLALPLALGENGSFNTVAQDTVEEVAQSVGVLLGTVKGERVMVPDYGVDDPTFSEPNTNEIAQIVAQWEPRAAVVVSLTTTPHGNAQVNVQVSLANES